jgi:protein subunit release factor A
MSIYATQNTSGTQNRAPELKNLQTKLTTKEEQNKQKTTSAERGSYRPRVGRIEWQVVNGTANYTVAPS